VPGVVATLSVAVGDATSSARLPVATLCTDATGYISFDLKPVDLGLAISGLFISAPKFRLANHDLLGALVTAPGPGAGDSSVPAGDAAAAAIDVGTKIRLGAAAGGKTELPCIVFPIFLESCSQDEPGLEDAACAPTRLPSIQSPDICDYRVSPFSFVTPSALKVGNDCCEILLPSSLPIQQYRFFKVVVRRGDARPAAEIDVTARVEVRVSDPLQSLDLAPVVKFGEVLEFRQDWYSLGHSLGEIKYSLPLAPGESTQLAVIDWSRDDLASRTDKLRATEFLDHDSRRDRAIEETVEAALREEQGGNSHMGSTAGTGGGTWGVPGVWGAGVTGNHAFGGGISYSYGNRDVEGESLQDLHDRVRQASTSVRSLNSTVIVQASQAEKSTLQTRRVANHNHCHALTIQYYEVLRHYRITTKFSARREAVLIPFALLPPFTEALALRFRTVLEQALLDPLLKPCFEALVRLHLAPSVYDAAKPPEPSGTTVNTKPVPDFEDQMTLMGSEGTGKPLKIPNLKIGDTIKITAEGRIAMSGGNGPGSAGVGPGGFSEPGAGGNFQYLAEPLVLRKFSLIYKIGYTGSWQQGSEKFELKATADGDLTIVFGVNNLPNGFFDFGPAGFNTWTISFKYPLRTDDAPTPTDLSKVDAASDAGAPFRKSADELCEARLLAHLNANRGFYSSAVWVLMDAVERRLYVEAALQSRPDILDGMDDRPIAVSGNSVAFPYTSPSSTSRKPGAAVEDIEDIVTLPTRGLFAEAQLGHCNSCEKRDVTRMWDWTEMTAETPPEIGGVAPGPKGQLPTLTPGQLPANVIQITQPQAAPDPTALANALGVLKTPDIFRDMAGLDEVSRLLGELAKASGDANSKAMALQAKERVDGMKKSTGSDAGSGSSGASAAADRFSLLPEIKTFAKEIGLTDDEYKQFALDQIYGTTSTGGSGGGSFISTVGKLVGGSLQGGVTGEGAPDGDAAIADAAETWGQDKVAMDAYVAFDDKKRVWFFSPNHQLAGAGSRPTAFADWKDWDGMHWRSRQVLLDLAGLKLTDVQPRTADVLLKLQDAYASWSPQQVAVFWGGGRRTSACNIFVGDSLAIRGINTTSTGGKYYSVGEITKGLGPFQEIPQADATRGDIVCFGSFHVEIVASVSGDRRAFCSVGVVRDPTGGQKCGKPGDNDDPRRMNSSLRFFRPSGS
jgi:hypothetical protein